jgi:single-stranded-DNA-specific exonuclease
MKYELLKPINSEYSLIEQIFHNRNIPIENIDGFLNPSIGCILNPYLLDNIEAAAELLLKHLKRNSKVFIQVDSDCDGYTSSSILLNWLYAFDKNLYQNIEFRIHTGKQHGLLEETIQYLRDNAFNLVIIPDAGSNQIDIHKLLLEINVDCIILDHHESDGLTSSAIIVNPQLDSYPNKNLSGAGVVYKFCKVLDDKQGVNYADKFLDLVALGMIADMMDTTELETRRLILTGLNNINNSFFKALIEKQAYSMKNEVTPTTIGFYIAPLINAVVRAGTEEEKSLIFSALLDSNAGIKIKSTKRGAKENDTEYIIENGCRLISNIRSRQNKLRDASVEAIEAKIESDGLNLNKIIVIINERLEDKNLSGLIANKLLGKYRKPIFILKETEEGLLQGSARGYEKSELQDFKSFVNGSQLCEYAEGHANAFGVGIKKGNLADFIIFSNEALKDISFDNRYLVDYIYDINYLRESDVEQIFSLRNLWGRKFEEPLFCVKNIKLKAEDITLLSANKNPTLKISYKNFSFLKFGFSQDEYQKLLPHGVGRTHIEVVGKFQLNEWSGNYYPQILIEDYNKIEEIKYYF